MTDGSCRVGIRLALGLTLLLSAAVAQAQAVSEGTLRVGIADAPPYTMKGEAGEWYGTNVVLWTWIASTHDLDFVWVEDTSADPVAQVVSGAVDIAITPAEVQASDERQIDFTYPYNREGFGVAVERDRWEGVLATLRAVTSFEFLLTMSLLSGLALLVGTVVWVLERWHSAGSFSRSPRRGIGGGFWWAVVTMTTVGYGDKTPITPEGRLVAILWMYMALILTAVVTAQLTAQISYDTRGSEIEHIEDLTGLPVAVLARSPARQALNSLGAIVVSVEDLDAGLQALKSDSAKALVANRRVLKWLTRSRSDIVVLGFTIGFNDYAFVLPQDFELRDTINVSLLNLLEREDWAVIEELYPITETE